MKHLNRPHTTAGFILLISSALVSAEPLTIKLPAETTQLRPSDLRGYTLATQRCLICHSADYIEYQPPRMQEKQWLAEVKKMQHAYGAAITDDEAKEIATYLALTYADKATPTQ